MKDPTLPNHKAHPKAMLIEGVPDDVKAAFKSACARTGRPMRGILIEFMKRFAMSKVVFD